MSMALLCGKHSVADCLICDIEASKKRVRELKADNSRLKRELDEATNKIKWYQDIKEQDADSYALFKKQLSNTQETIKELVGGLKNLEWMYIKPSTKQCPACHALKNDLMAVHDNIDSGHKFDCWLSALIAKAKGKV
jgi:predicted RNase H-like nuclease (RuvC/YqgF family)